MNIESINAGNASGVAPVVSARPSGETQFSAPQGTAKRAAPTETQGLEQGSRNDAKSLLSKEQEKQQVTDAVEKLSKFVSSIRPEISFSVDENSGTRVVKVIDRQSNEVLRQIPSEEAIQLAQALDKLQGLFVRDTA